MGLRDELQKLKFDKRLIDWNLKHKVVSDQELKKHLDSLTDLAAQAMTLEQGARGESNGSTQMGKLHS